MFRHFCISLFFCVYVAISFAQQNNYVKKIWIPSDSLQLDTLPIIYGSLVCDTFKENTDFKINYATGYVKWISNKPPDSLVMLFKTLSLNLNQTYYRNNPAIEKTPYSEGQLGYIPASKKKGNTSESQLTTLGNLSRGIGFGNNQDVTVNSNLNLRINGKLANDVDILAAISDENNPIQPEGNTQQLQDFDKVFIELKKDNTKITLGDFQMNNSTNSYFINYFKKSRGIQFNQSVLKPVGQFNMGGEIAVARGRFSRNVLDGIEGNRGPYRLKGTHGEIFIIIIAGTERIYLDGKQLERGEQNDYVIDYNSGELTFMPRIIITKFSRIIAEFQYSDRNYARNVVTQYNQYTKGNVKAYLNFFREADNKNQPFQQALDGYDSLNNLSARQILAQAGDAPVAYIPSAKKYTSLLPDKVLYVLVNDPVLGNYYKQAENDAGDSVFYAITFSYLGPNQGNYRQKLSGANGRVYEFVAPVNGVKQGEFEPVETVIPAKSYMAANGGLAYTLAEVGTIKTEWVWNKQDLNTFSKLDDKDNQGLGTKISWEGIDKPDTAKNWHWQHKASFEWVSQQFRFVERYRDVEFDRKWNRTLQNPDADNSRVFGEERIGDIVLGLKYKQKLALKYNLGLYQMRDVKQGILQQAEASYRTNKLKSSALGILSQIGNDTAQNKFEQLGFQLAKPIKNWEPGLYYQHEKSTFAIHNTLTNGSYAFQLLGVSLNNAMSKQAVKYNLDVNQRSDQQTRQQSLQAFSVAKTIAVNGTWRGQHNNQIGLTSTFRNLQFAADSLQTENTLQTRYDASLYFFKKAVNWQSFWQIGTGQEQRREFSYLQVQPGNGVYIWNDYDSNGLQTLNEFETASELDRNRANYIRVFTPVQGFIQSIHAQMNQTLRLEPGKLTQKKKSVWGRFSSISTFNLEQKQTGSLAFATLNPLRGIADSFLVSSNNGIRHTLFFNRAAPIFGADYNYIQNENKLLLVNGFEWRTKKEQQLRIRWNLGRNITLNAGYNWGLRSYYSAYFTQRNFAYTYRQLEPKIQYQHQNSWRLIGYVKLYQAQNNPLMGNEHMKSGEYGLEGRWLQADKGVIAGGLALVNIAYNGQTNSSLSYDLLQGLQPGNNVKWNMNIERRVATKVQISAVYDGRKSPQVKTIHLGRVVARYLF